MSTPYDELERYILSTSGDAELLTTKNDSDCVILNASGVLARETTVQPFLDAIFPLIGNYLGAGDFATLMAYDPSGISNLVERKEANAQGPCLRRRDFNYLNPKNGVGIAVSSFHTSELLSLETTKSLIVSVEICRNLENNTVVLYHAFKGSKKNILELSSAIQPLLDQYGYEVAHKDISDCASTDQEQLPDSIEKGAEEDKVIIWARQNLVEKVAIVPITKNRLVMGLAYSGIFLTPGAFILLGLILLIISPDEREAATTSLACGVVLLIPFGTIALIGYLVRSKFPESLTVDGVKFRSGVLLPWKSLKRVDHVTKFVDRGTASDREVKDNNLDLVFESRTVTVPPLIRDKERIWQLIHSIPCEHREA